jgi:NADPH:quinone reductase-like Zn-dependent oxidoreductase
VKGEIIRRVTESVWPNIESGAIRPNIHAVVPVAEAQKAHAMLENSEAIGKVILAV